jgi:stage IV sporulation protein FB
LRLGKVFISGGFVFCFSVLYIILSFEFIFIIILAIVLHEAGHLIAIKKLGGKINEIRLESMGALISYDGSNMSYVSELLAALAGPLMSLLIALLAAFLGKKFGGLWFTLSGFSLIFCIFNLLPIAVLGGGRMLYMTMAHCWGLDIAERAGFSVSCAFSLLIMILGAWVLKESGWNFTLMLCGVWLFWASAIVKKPVWV